MAAEPTRLLVLCKTVPAPDPPTREAAQVVAVDAQGAFVRLTGVPTWLIEDERSFRKGQWITTPLTKAGDGRPETYRPSLDCIVWDTPPPSSIAEGTPANGSEWLRALEVFRDFTTLRKAHLVDGRTLGLLCPAKVVDVLMQPVRRIAWTEAEQQVLRRMQRQAGLDERAALPDKPCFNFHLRHQDADGTTLSHRVVDWSLLAFYRQLCAEHARLGWRRSLTQCYEHSLPSADVVLLLGATARNADHWLVLGVLLSGDLAEKAGGVDDPTRSSTHRQGEARTGSLASDAS